MVKIITKKNIGTTWCKAVRSFDLMSYAWAALKELSCTGQHTGGF